MQETKRVERRGERERLERGRVGKRKETEKKRVKKCKDSHVDVTQIAVVILDHVFVFLAVKHRPQKSAQPSFVLLSHNILSWVNGSGDNVSRGMSQEHENSNLAELRK